MNLRVFYLTRRGLSDGYSENWHKPKKAATEYCGLWRKKVSFGALRKMRLPLRLKGKVWTMSSLK